MSASSHIESGIATIKKERERLLLESLSPADLRAEIRGGGWEEIVVDGRFAHGYRDDDSDKQLGKLFNCFAMNRSITKVKIDGRGIQMSPSWFLSVSNIPSLRVVDVKCRAIPSEVAALSLLLRKAHALEEVAIELLYDRDTLTFVLNEIPDALQESCDFLREVQITLINDSKALIHPMNLNDFFFSCAALSGLECFRFGERRSRFFQEKVSATICDNVLDRLLSSGIRDISLYDVILLDREEAVDSSHSTYGDYGRLRCLELRVFAVSTLNVQLFQQMFEKKGIGLQNLIIHDIENNNTSVGRRGFWLGKTLDSISKSSLSKIQIPGCCMSPLDEPTLYQLPARIAPLAELDISGTVIYDETALALSDAVSSSSALRVLALRGCSIGVAGSHTLSRCLASNPGLERLTVTGLFDTLPSECKQNFFESLAVNDSLKMLDISENEFTRNEFFTLTQSLSSGSLLEELEYKRWNGNGSGFLILGRSLFLHENESLTSLTIDGRFSSSNRSDAGLMECQVFGNALQENKILQKLYLSGCQLGDAGCAALLSGLGQNHVLREIGLSGNTFGDEACGVLAAVLRENMTLEAIQLGSCVPGDDALIEVVDALCTNSCLRYFYLRPQHIEEYTEELGREVLNMLQVNCSLKYFSLPCARPEYRKACSFYLRLNQLDRGEIIRRSSTGESRDLALKALMQCSNDLECIFYILRMSAHAIF